MFLGHLTHFGTLFLEGPQSLVIIHLWNHLSSLGVVALSFFSSKVQKQRRFCYATDENVRVVLTLDTTICLPTSYRALLGRTQYFVKGEFLSMYNCQ